MIKELFGFGTQILDKFVPSRIERIKNRKDILEDEKEKILNKKGRISSRELARLELISDELSQIDKRLYNAAKD